MEHHVRNFCHPNPPIDYKPFVSIKIITIDWFVLWMRKHPASMEYHFFFFFSKMGLSGFTSRLRSKSRGPFGKRKNNSWAKLRSFKSSGISSSSDRFSLRLLLPPPTSLALLLLKVPTGDNSTLHFVYPVFELLASVSPWTRRRLKTEDGFRRNIERTKLQYPGKKKIMSLFAASSSASPAISLSVSQKPKFQSFSSGAVSIHPKCNKFYGVQCQAAKSQKGPVKRRQSSSSASSGAGKRKKKGRSLSGGEDAEIVDDFVLGDGDDKGEVAALSNGHHPSPLPNPPAGFVVDDQGSVVMVSNKRVATIVRSFSLTFSSWIIYADNWLCQWKC